MTILSLLGCLPDLATADFDKTIQNIQNGKMRR